MDDREATAIHSPLNESIGKRSRQNTDRSGLKFSPNLPNQERITLIETLNAVIAGEKPFVYFEYGNGKNPSNRGVRIPGLAANAHLGYIVAVRFNADGHLFFRLKDKNRGNGDQNWDWTNTQPEKIHRFINLGVDSVE